MMKHCSFALAAAALLALSSSSLHAQAIPEASRGGAAQVGALYSNASTDEYQKRIGGVTFFGDFDLTPHLGVEGVGHFTELETPQDFAEESYMVGPRYTLHYGRFQPYVKALIGIGRTLDQETYIVSPGTPRSYFAVGLGGGLDVRFSHRLTVRAIDFEYQDWPSFPPNGLTPSIISAGVAYRIR